MKLLVVRPGKVPAEQEIDSSLGSMQAVVGGTIQAIYPFDDAVALICNEEGKNLGLPLDRALFDPETHRIVEIISGTFFICGAPADSEAFASLTGEQVRTYRRRFASPEQFIKVGGDIFALPKYL